MYQQRAKILISIMAALLVICLWRLAQMQLAPRSKLQSQIEQLKQQRRKFLKTARGKIIDRNGKVLAADKPEFELHIYYSLTHFLDERTKKAELLNASKKDNAEQAKAVVEKTFQDGLEELKQIIDKCSFFGPSPQQIEDRIRQINDHVWNARTFQAWRRNFLDAQILKEYNDNVVSIPLEVAVENFQEHEPDQERRYLLIGQVQDITEIHKSWHLLDLDSEDDIFTAQVEFMDANYMRIVPASERVYPYSTVACQTIGWVGPEQQRELFADDRLARYLHGELSGRAPGAEYVCETILRGRRGELVYNMDQELIGKYETQVGQDVRLTLDIELQERVEQYITDPQLNPNNWQAPTAVVVIEVESGDILVMASLPVYDLNRIRYEYGDILRDKNRPLRNRAIAEHYPPGSAAKPLILIAGLESGKIASSEVINCPAEPAPKGWPSCWVYNRFKMGHDWSWQNYARNAIKGSCNIYFSRLADRLEPRLLQSWLFKFGYGHEVRLAPAEITQQVPERTFIQSAGIISSVVPNSPPESFDDIGPLSKSELRYFGIGQGNFRVTPLQVANAMAAIARGGIYMEPRLIVNQSRQRPMSLHLNISSGTLSVVRDGMHAVVNESGGTANKEFGPMLSHFEQAGVKIYGKTGSTEAPDAAWFAGFAEDDNGRKISIAVLVEGGQHGSRDAAPIARDTINFCIEAGYLGETMFAPE